MIAYIDAKNHEFISAIDYMLRHCFQLQVGFTDRHKKLYESGFKTINNRLSYAGISRQFSGCDSHFGH